MNGIILNKIYSKDVSQDKIIKLIKKENLNKIINKVDSQNNTLLMICILKKRDLVAFHLINNFPDYCFPDKVNNEGKNALLCAQEFCFENVIIALLNKFGDKCLPISQTTRYEPILFWAIKHNSKTILEKILKFYRNDSNVWNYVGDHSYFYYIIKNNLSKTLGQQIIKKYFTNININHIKTIIKENFDSFMNFYLISNFMNKNLEFFKQIVKIINNHDLGEMGYSVIEYLCNEEDIDFLYQILLVLDDKINIFFDSAYSEEVADMVFKILNNNINKHYSKDLIALIIRKRVLKNSRKENRIYSRWIVLLIKNNINVLDILQYYTPITLFDNDDDDDNYDDDDYDDDGDYDDDDDDDDYDDDDDDNNNCKIEYILNLMMKDRKSNV